MEPEVIVYGRETCKICKAAAQKLELMKIPFEKRDIDQVMALHDGWRTDGSVEVSAAYHASGGHLPVIKLGSFFLPYAEAMRKIKGRGGKETGT